MEEKHIYKPFNTTFFTSMGVYSLFLEAVLFFQKRKPRIQQKKFVCLFYIFSLVVFTIYKYAISKDEYYWRLMGFDKFCLFDELPLNVCNIVLVLMPVGIWLESRTLLGICFFSSLILSPLALLMPAKGFSGYSIFTPRVFGYIFTHFMAISAGVMLLQLDLYRPRLSDLPKIFVVTLSLDFLMFIVNLIFRKTGLDKNANYFYNTDPVGTPAFELLYKFIPFKFLYTLPLFAAFALLSWIITILIG